VTPLDYRRPTASEILVVIRREHPQFTAIERLQLLAEWLEHPELMPERENAQ
jgi:hypothetical protein